MIFERKSVEAGEETLWIPGRAFRAGELREGGAEQSESGEESWGVRSEEGVEKYVCVWAPGVSVKGSGIGTSRIGGYQPLAGCC